MAGVALLLHKWGLGLLRWDLTTSSNGYSRNISPPWPRGQSTRFSKSWNISWACTSAATEPPPSPAATLILWVAAAERHPDSTLVIELTPLLARWRTSCLHPAQSSPRPPQPPQPPPPNCSPALTTFTQRLVLHSSTPALLADICPHPALPAPPFKYCSLTSRAKDKLTSASMSQSYHCGVSSVCRLCLKEKQSWLSFDVSLEFGTEEQLCDSWKAAVLFPPTLPPSCQR